VACHNLETDNTDEHHQALCPCSKIAKFLSDYHVRMDMQVQSQMRCALDLVAGAGGCAPRQKGLCDAVDCEPVTIPPSLEDAAPTL